MSYYWTVGGEEHSIDTSLTVVKLDFHKAHFLAGERGKVAFCNH